MQSLEVNGAVRSIYGSLGVKRLSIDQMRVEFINSGLLQDTEEFPGRWRVGGWGGVVF